MPAPRYPRVQCAVPGCRSYAVHGKAYCRLHVKQYEDNLRLGVADPTPRLIGAVRRLCGARGCGRAALANSDYCVAHAREMRAQSPAEATIAAAFTEMKQRLREVPPDSLSGVRRELELLDQCRTILLAHAEECSVSGWREMSMARFVRLWLDSAATRDGLEHSRWVMENAEGSYADRLLANVYARIDSEPAPLQQGFTGLLP